jgi:acetoin utilization deacetylase AcuC-like enzyme
MPIDIVHHPDYDARFPPSHRFPMGKYSLLMEALRRRGLVDPSRLHEPEPIGADLLTLAHDPIYVEQVLTRSVPDEIEREIGFPVDERVARRAHLATSGTLLAARLALAKGLACNTAGGSHHARRTQGAGFCTFNDVGVAALTLLAEDAVRRVLVVDLDVHQGDGTADVCAAEPRVFTFSMHGEKNYPVRKIPSDLDVSLPDGTGDDAYMAKLEPLLQLLSDYARPDLVFYNAGVDPHASDRLGKLSLTDEGLRQRDHAVIGHFRQAGVPVCGVIGGGYSADVPALAERHAILFEVATAFVDAQTRVAVSV